MAARAIGSGTISFGLVSIPIKIYPAAASEGVSFHILHAKCGTRIKLQQLCPTCNEVVDRSQQVRSYEFARDQYVRFTDQELKSLEGESSRIIELEEFVPTEKVDPVYFDRAYYLGPDKGGEKAYRLLADTMAKSRRVALAKFMMRGKEALVLIRSAAGGLMLHTLYYAHEVRNFGEIEKGETTKAREGEIDLAMRLVSELSTDKFEPEKYQDEYRKRVLELVDIKVEGREVTAAPPPVQRAQVIDLMEALKQSLARKIAKEKKVAAVAGAQATESIKETEELTLEEFKSTLQATGLEMSDRELKRSFEGLRMLRDKNRLPWKAIRAKVRKLKDDLKVATQQPDLLEKKVKKLRAARIPLTAKDWDRY